MRLHLIAAPGFVRVLPPMAWRDVVECDRLRASEGGALPRCRGLAIIVTLVEVPACLLSTSVVAILATGRGPIDAMGVGGELS